MIYQIAQQLFACDRSIGSIYDYGDFTAYCPFCNSAMVVSWYPDHRVESRNCHECQVDILFPYEEFMDTWISWLERHHHLYMQLKLDEENQDIVMTTDSEEEEWESD